jgi:hypothetical protein
MPSGAAPSSVVTLVHGTFATGSRWPALAQVLEETLPGPVACEYFDWPGGFTVRARAQAASQLREVLRRRFADHPGADHYILAHSHGGNVVLGALDVNVVGSDFLKRVKLVVCLSTPFLTVYPRASRAPEYFAMIGLLVWSYVALRHHPTIFLWTALPLFLGLVIALYALRSRAHRIAKTMWHDVAAAFPLRILRSAADEAALLLAVAQSITHVLRWLVDALVGVPSVARGFARLTWRVLGDVVLALAQPDIPLSFSGKGLLAVPLTAAALALLTWLAFAYDWPWGIRWIVAGLLALITTPVWASALVIVPLVLSSVIVAPLVFLIPWALFLVGGGQLVLVGSFMNVVVEPTPVGTWTVHQLPWPSTGSSLRLRHSASYYDAQALEQIRRWLIASGEQNRGR